MLLLWMKIMHTCGEACGKFQHICGFKGLYTITQLKPVGISLLKHTQKIIILACGLKVQLIWFAWS